MILFLMFLTALNVFDRFYFCIFGAAIVFLLNPGRKIRFNSSVVMLLGLGLSVLLFNPTAQDSILDMIRPFSYILCYIIGFGLFQNAENAPVDLRTEEKRMSSVIYVIAGGSFLRFVLNMFVNWGSENRNEVIDFWTRSEMAATAQAALACLAIAVAVAFLFSKVGKWKKLIAIGALVVVVLYNLVLAGRTLFVIIILTAAIAIIYAHRAEKRKMSKAFIIILALVLLLTVLYNTDAFGIRTAVESSNFYMRFYGGAVTQDIEEDKRMEHKLAFLERFLDHPWGGSNIRTDYGHHAHDIYLDTYDESSIFALIAILAYMISSIVRMVKCARKKVLSLRLRLLVLCAYLVCNFEFFVEPIMSGMPWMLASYCFMDGAVTYLLQRVEGVEPAGDVPEEKQTLAAPEE